MTTLTPYRSTTVQGRDGFGRMIRAEWTKLRSVPRWMLALVAAIVLTVLVALLMAGGSQMERAGGGGPVVMTLDPYNDEGRFAYRTLAGDGTLVTRVTAQDGSHRDAKAGLMIRSSTRPGSPYAAVMVTPGRGVRLQTDFTTDIAGGPGTAPRWLKLTRAGSSVTGYESADGTRWNRIGAVTVDGLAANAVAGAFVASPEQIKVERQFGGESVTGQSTEGTATFSDLAVHPADPQPAGAWRDDAGKPVDLSSGTVTLTGMGDVGPRLFATDVTRDALGGTMIGMMAIIALAVLFMTSEYRNGLIHLTFAAAPRRGRVLAAKAIVIAAAACAAGLAAALGAVLLSVAVMRSKNVIVPTVTEGPVLRAVLGTGLLLALIAVLTLALAAITRRAAAAIAVPLLVLLLPQILSRGLPVSAARWLDGATPAAGFAIQQTLHRYDTVIGPWAGLGVLAAYTAVAFAAAVWLVRRRDA
ncbi:ABC transporter permease subunit [Actinomadura sp. 9N407]|uniref:ABC transporter permease subunit n=1 Tax=Actinomadura sp. 9N407 TaxID=3375154 RepID=UPI0037AE4FA3